MFDSMENSVKIEKVGLFKTDAAEQAAVVDRRNYSRDFPISPKKKR